MWLGMNVMRNEEMALTIYLLLFLFKGTRSLGRHAHKRVQMEIQGIAQRGLDGMAYFGGYGRHMYERLMSAQYAL
ncbi:hypothetical protein BGW80DRAFT_1350200 [Lactifluus volemus]|jgi:hypothetical protein|nr:hypothetical protein BGW80DRAFT_1350200 [Lactifluus volemus]